MATQQESIIRNSLFGLSTWVLPLILSFVATPIIVTSLGNENYGIYALVLGFVGYSFNFGIGRAITKYLAEYRAEGTSENATKIISATLTLNLVVGVTGAAVVFFLSGWLVDTVFMIGAENRQKTIYAFYFAALIIFMTMMSQIGSSVLQGVHRFDTYSRLFNVNNFGIVLGNVILALSGYGLLWLLGWNLIVLSATTIAGVLIARRIVPEFSISLGFSKEAFSKILGFSTWVIGYQVLGNVLLLFERGWIIRNLGAEALTHYVVPMTIGLLIHSSIGSLMVVLFPLASEQVGDLPKLERLYRKATKITCILIFFIVSSLIVKSYPFLTLWMGEEFAKVTTNLLIIHTVSFGMLAILIVSWQFADGLGHPGYNCLIFLMCLVISLSGMIFLIGDYGNEGIAFSRLAGFAAMFLTIIYSEKWFFGRFGGRFWLKMLSVLVPAAMLAALTEYILISNLNASWLLMVGATIAGGVVYLGVLLLFGFVTDDEKALVRKVLRL